MKAEIVSVGTELLLGHVVNTNTSYISRGMAELGIDVYYHSTVGDNAERLSSELKKGLERSDIIFTTGGLGPTVDDITVAVVSGVTKKRLIKNRGIEIAIKKYFSGQRIPAPKESFRQAYVPKGALCLENRLGTAPGLIIPHCGRLIVCLPGPPRELNPILDKGVIPYLAKRCGVKEILISRTIRLTGLPEAAVNSKVKDLLRLGGSTTVGIYTRLAEVDLKITSKAGSKKKCLRRIKRIESKIRERFAPYIYGVDSETLEGAAGMLLLKRKKTLAVAESCTGGLISHRITGVSGSSKYFRMGLVAYSNEAKLAQLGVPPSTLKKHGAVSGPVALAMASGIKKGSASDIGIGVTGVAGPAGGSAKKPVGLVCVALAAGKKRLVRKYFFLGGRNAIKHQAACAALDLLRKHLK